MEGRKPPPPVTVQRAFAPTRLSDELLAQAYDQILQRAQLMATSQESPAPRPTRSRKRVARVTTTGGRKR